METIGSNFQCRQIPSISSNTGYCEYKSFLFREIPSATSAIVGNHMGTHQIPLDTFGNPEHSNYLLFKRFLRRTRSSDKRRRPQTICSRASILFIRTNPVKIQIYRQLLLATQIPSNTQVFDGIWIANVKYRILSNTAKYYMGTTGLNVAGKKKRWSFIVSNWNFKFQWDSFLPSVSALEKLPRRNKRRVLRNSNSAKLFASMTVPWDPI